MLKRISVLLAVFTLLFSMAATAQKYNFETVPNDPFGVKMYTLDNGLKVYLSVNKDAPRIQTYIAIKAGSKFDPPQTTGLAHYLEHMVFKGTTRIGTTNWPAEKVLLDSVSNLFEWHMMEKDPAKKAALYKRIDSFSFEASKYAIPNEYDKMTTSIGAQGTNAFTSTDMTVYVNDIPSNSLQKFLMLESERFQTLVLRLFHTELETVYEEFNRSQDNDRRWSDFAINNLLLQNHPYGTQTTIGEGEHLKNPSMVNIYNYFNTYYRPNNCAIIMSGDLDPDQTIAMIEKYFGTWQTGQIPQFKPITPVQSRKPVTEITGPQPEHVYVGYLFKGANTREALMLKLVDNILANGQAGLIDIDLVQKQKVLQAYSFIDDNNDFCFHKFYAEPKEGQSLEEVKNLLLEEVEKLKKGEFDGALIPAIVQNMKLQRMKTAETNEGRAGTMMGTFVHNIAWADWVKEIDELAKVTKADVVAFANEHYKDNAVCYKKQGDAKTHKVEKPQITSISMVKDRDSDFKKEWDRIEQTKIDPKFIDFNNDITHKTLKGTIPFDYIKNTVNKTFSLYYIFDMGTDNMRELGLAISYLEYLGTSKYTPEALKMEFYKLGLSFSVSSSRDRVYVNLSGLEENLDKGVALFEQLLSDAQPNEEVYAAMAGDIMTKRANAKKNKNAILNGMVNYAKYGNVNPFNNVMSNEEINKVDCNKLVAMVKSLSTYKHKMFYYGQRSPEDAMAVVGKYHVIPATLKEYPPAKKYDELPLNEQQLFYTCNYPMKQAEIMIISKGQRFSADNFPFAYMYNEYYGSGLSSIMFQEIREKMALAYSVYSTYSVPQNYYESHYVQSYVGTQGDKLNTALMEMKKLLNNMPEVNMQFEGARENVVKTLESDWITRDAIYWAYDRALKRGLKEDVRKMIYGKVQTMKLSDLQQFFKNNVAGHNVNYCAIGSKESVNEKTVMPFGKNFPLSLEDIFGY